MADDGSEQSKSIWPLPKFCFTVDLGDGGDAASFQEVSGLSSETQPIEYRHGDSKVFSPITCLSVRLSLCANFLNPAKGYFQWCKALYLPSCSSLLLKCPTLAVNLKLPSVSASANRLSDLI